MSERQYIYGDREILIPKTAPGDNWLEISVNGTRARLPKGVTLYLSDAAYEVVTQALADWHPPSDPAERDKLPATIGDVKRIAGEGGGGTTVTLTETDETNVYTADMTVAEVIEAYRRGPVYVRMAAGRSAEAVLRVYMAEVDEGDGVVYATVGIPSSSGLFAIQVVGAREKGVETWQVKDYSIGVSDNDLYFGAVETETGKYDVTTREDYDRAYDASESRSLRVRISMTGVSGYSYLYPQMVDWNGMIFSNHVMIGDKLYYLRLDWVRDGESAGAGLTVVPVPTAS